MKKSEEVYETTKEFKEDFKKDLKNLLEVFNNMSDGKVERSVEINRLLVECNDLRKCINELYAGLNRFKWCLYCIQDEWFD